MQRITKIMTDDGTCFDTEKEARKYLEVKYGNQLTMIANKILLIEKYVPLCEFIENNLDLFKELIEFKNEFEEKIETEGCYYE